MLIDKKVLVWVWHPGDLDMCLLCVIFLIAICFGDVQENTITRERESNMAPNHLHNHWLQDTIDMGDSGL